VSQILDVTMLPAPQIDVIAGGPQGPPGPVGPPGGPMAGWVTPQQFGAVGNGVADDTAAVRAAASASHNAGGGFLYLPPGTYRCTGALTYYPGQIWQGAGFGASALVCANDLWAGGTAMATPFLAPATSGWSQQTMGAVRDLTLRGPGGGSLGRAGAKTNGLRTVSMGRYDNLEITGFFGGIECVADHEMFLNVYSLGNYYGITFSDAKVSSANQNFETCRFTGNYLASFHISGNAALSSATLTQTHLGFSPLGFYRTDAQSAWDGNGNPVYAGAGAIGPGINQSVMNMVMFEQCGNAALLDTNTANQQALNASRLTECFFSWGAAYKSTLAPLTNADWQGAWCVWIPNADTQSVLELANAWAPGSAGIFKTTGPGTTIRTATVNAAMFGSGTSWSNASTNRMWVDWAQNTNHGARCGLYSASSVINVGDLVEFVAANAFVTRATGTRPVLGVAVTPSGASGTSAVLVALSGAVSMNAAVGSLPIGVRLYLNTTTPYLVDNTSTAMPAVGVSWATGGASNVNAFLRL
jgi:hypothetical protein